MTIIDENEKLIVNIVCIKWGNKYSSKDVNLLYSMLKNNIKNYRLNFYCFTDDSQELNTNIISKPLPVLNVLPEDNKYVYQKEVGLCDNNLGGLNGKRVIFFDLDIVITGVLDDLIAYPQGDDFVIINDWGSKGSKVGQASCYSWVVGTLGYVKDDFEKDPKKWLKTFFTASQEYLSYKVIEKTGKLNFWPTEWVSSFKFSCLPVWFLRPWVEPKMPEKTKVLVFHGEPKAESALIGQWPKTPLWKKIYKTIKPSPWLKKYLEQ